MTTMMVIVMIRMMTGNDTDTSDSSDYDNDDGVSND